MWKARYSLQNKVVLITGAASGVGRALSEEAFRAGARLALIDRDASGLNQVCAWIEQSGGQARPYICDLSRPEEVRETVERIQREVGPVDALANCAAKAVDGLVEDVPLEDFKYSYDVNFYGPLVLIQAVIPMMKQRRSGQIVNVSTSMGRRAYPGKVSYCVTKFALNALTEGLRLELKPFHINVMMVSPGPMNTNLVRNTTQYGTLEIRGDRLIKREDPSKIARKIIRGIERRARVVVQWTPAEILVHVNCFFPRLVDYVLSKAISIPGPSPKDRIAV